MTQVEQIEQAAESYTREIIDSKTFDVNFEEDNYDAGSLYATYEVCPMAFKAGADWRINSVWHDAREEPIKEKGRWLAFCGGIKVFMCEEWHGQFLWSVYVSMLGIIMWAYVDDLLPTKGGENEND